ncbi:MAG: WG repeat-containing protein, partial [Clostridia bacterium]|nr:WG repeat-containing protein [Clostridia bacterium]
MKKIFILILATMLLLGGCNKALPQNENETQDIGEQEPAENVDNFDIVETPSCDTKYDPQKILFVADSDADDAEIYYCFNYRGELLEETDVFPEYYSSNGLMAASAPNGQVGFADEDGLFVIEPIYYDAMPFSEDGYSRVVKILDEDNYWNSK